MITVLYWQQLTQAEQNAAKLARFLGAEVAFRDLAGESVVGPGGSVSECACAIARAGTLAKVIPQDGELRQSLESLIGRKGRLLAFDFDKSAEAAGLLDTLTEKQLIGVRETGPQRLVFHVLEGPQRLCRQFSGLQFTAPRRDCDLTFVEGETKDNLYPLIRIGIHPFLTCLEKEGQQVLLLACSEIANIDEAVSRDTSAAEIFSQVVPLLIFLAEALGKRRWQSDTPRACFIVDDPCLKPSYGFLNYEKLLSAIGSRPFSMSIAFIPWNHRRSSKETVDLFKRESERLSLCVHGCDHTSREFGSGDYSLLRHQAAEAFERMRDHEVRTGLVFDDVMVFPQGFFSTAAIQALQACGYLAAVNSTAFPTDPEHGSLCLRDLLDVAVTAFGDFPVFCRRYPTDLVGIALDLFLGKPALLVEHHNYFRDGYDDLLTLVDRLNAMEPRLEWSGLSEICSQACWKRELENGETEVRFFTDRFELANNSHRSRRYTLARKRFAGQGLSAMTLNGQLRSWEEDSDRLVTHFELDAGCRAKLTMKRHASEKPFVTISSGKTAGARVFLRRWMSEVRDNHIDKSPLLNRVARKIRDVLVKKQIMTQ